MSSVEKMPSDLSEFKTLCETEIKNFGTKNPKIEALIDPNNKRGYDYRAQDARFTNNCITFLFLNKSTGDLLTMVTLIYVDQDISNEFSFVRLQDDRLEEVGLETVATLPVIITGFCQVFTEEVGHKYIFARWYLGFMERLAKLGLSLLIEIQGTYSEDEKGNEKSLAGQVHPQSKPVATAVRLLNMEKVEGCYEKNTLGSVYQRVAQNL